MRAQYTADGKQGGRCEFQAQESTAQLVIKVTATSDTHQVQCGAHPKPLKAIGNEAMVCTTPQQSRVAGRVRDQAFVITMKPGNKEEQVKKAAEIVAGNLF